MVHMYSHWLVHSMHTVHPRVHLMQRGHVYRLVHSVHAEMHSPVHPLVHPVVQPLVQPLVQPVHDPQSPSFLGGVRSGAVSMVQVSVHSPQPSPSPQP